MRPHSATPAAFLLARTPNAPIVKEVKPAAMIGYRGVEVRPARDKHGNDDLFEPKAVEVTESGTLNLSEPVKGYTKQGKLEVPIVDTGENGVFTAGEFVAITAMGQMEYITPEEIAQVVVHEIRGVNTGQDIISALDGSVLNPSYKAGLLRNAAMHDLAAAEADSRIPRSPSDVWVLPNSPSSSSSRLTSSRARSVASMRSSATRWVRRRWRMRWPMSWSPPESSVRRPASASLCSCRTARP